MKNIILLAFLLFPVLIQAQILPNQTSEKDPEGTDAIYTQENGTLNKILFDSAFYFFIPRIKTNALSYSITSTDNPDSLRGYFVLDNTATWYYIASDASSVSLGGGGGGGTTQLLSYSGTNLSISGGNTVSLANLLDNTDTQLTEAEVDAFVANNGYLTSYTETDPVWTADKPSYATTAYVDANDDTGTDDQTAAEVSVTPAGNLTSTNVQDALEEIQTQVDGLGGGGTADGVATSGTYNAGTENIDITVASPGSNFSIDVSALLDNTDAQAISLDGNTLNISGNVSAVDLSPYLDNTDAQAISLAGTVLSITGNASTVDLSAIQDGTGTDDQTAAEVSVTPTGNLNSTDVQAALQEHQLDIDALASGAADGVITGASYNAGTEQIDVTVAAPGSSFSFDVSALLDNTDAQDLSLSGNTLSLTGDGTTVDLSGYLDNTDGQTVAFDGTNLSITGGNSVDISSLTDGTGTDDQQLTLVGNDLTLEDGGASIDLSGYLDNTDAQAISLATNTLSITGNASTVDLSPYLDNTDDQVIDVFAFDGTNLTLSLESDGEATKSIDLSSLSTNTTYDFIQLNTAFDNQDFSIGEIGWSENDEVRIGILDNYDFAVGQDMYKAVHNTTASPISAGTAVMMTGADGNSNVFTIAPMTYPAIGSEFLIGVAAVDIAAGATGIAVQNGYVKGLDIDGQGWTEGDVLYLDEVSAGGLTTTPGDVLVAAVTKSGTNGSIYVRPDFYAGLSQAESDAVGAMVSGNTETLIDVSYQADNTIDFVVNDDLSLYDNTASGFLTSEVDGSITNEIQTLSWSAGTAGNDEITLSDGGSTITITDDVDDADADPTNEIQDLSLASDVLSLSGDATTVDLSVYLDNTDNQSITYNLSNYLLSLTNGGSVNLSSLAQTIGIVDEFLAISGVTTGASVPIINTVESAVSGSTTVAVDLESAYNRVVQLDMTSGGSSVTLSVSNPVSGGVYTFHFQNTTNHDINFPANFLKADGTTWDGGSTVNYSADDWLTCYYDGTNFYCK